MAETTPSHTAVTNDVACIDVVTAPIPQNQLDSIAVICGQEGGVVVCEPDMRELGLRRTWNGLCIAVLVFVLWQNSHCCQHSLRHIALQVLRGRKPTLAHKEVIT